MENASQKGRHIGHTNNVVNDFVRTVNVDTDYDQSQLLKMNIWDAAGDQNVHNLAHLFVKDVQCGILTYSVDSRMSFDQLDEWNRHLQEANEDCLVVVVGNKSDLSDARSVSLQ